MLKVGFAGFRGMVGSVILQRIKELKLLEKITPVYLSCSPNASDFKTHDAKDLDILKELDIILVSYGSEYTQEIYPKLKKSTWQGYWIDAASALRYDVDSTLVLDPINKNEIIKSLNNNKKIFVGANCTVSLLLLSLRGIIGKNLIDWISFSSYQAISGAGAKSLNALLLQVKDLAENIDYKNQKLTALDLAKQAQIFLQENYGKNPALICNLHPFIDELLTTGQTKEEAKASKESKKILKNKDRFAIDGTCVRVATLRSHAQSLHFELKKNLSIEELESFIKENSYVDFIKNEKTSSLKDLTPLSASNSLKIKVGRLKKMQTGKNHYSLFTCGDQLLFGAAEPLVRLLSYLIQGKF